MPVMKVKASARPLSQNKPSLISPAVDLVCGGGASIVLMVGLLIFIAFDRGLDFAGSSRQIDFGRLLVLQALLNWPHFLGSYRLLYSVKGNYRKYPFSTVFVPFVLLVFLAYTVYNGKGSDPDVLYVDQQLSYILWLFGAFYLAWHYTGQAWGMVKTFSNLAGIQMNRMECWLIRCGLRSLLVWHIVWGAQDLPAQWLGRLGPVLPDLLVLCNGLVIVSLIVGVVGFIRVRKRTGIMPTAQMVVPWAAIFIWYMTLYFEPGVYLFVQLAHSLQYLIFPVRAELNRLGVSAIDKNVISQLIVAFRFYIMLVVLGLAVFYLPETVINNGNQQFTFAILTASLISIHHYFIDGCIWKLSNPDVRKILFSHINLEKKN
jgi:hypothetical protein